VLFSNDKLLVGESDYYAKPQIYWSQGTTQISWSRGTINFEIMEMWNVHS
jgi:hypothetical protein